MMQGVFAWCLLVFVFLAKRAKAEGCELKTQWGGDACTLHGSLTAESVPGRLPVTRQKCNQFYQKADFKQQPAVSYPDAKQGEVYTLVMVDPDAPNHAEGKYFLHWIIANIPGEDLKVGNFKKAKVITSYRGPSPPEGTGTHRYMFLVYRHEKAEAMVTEAVPDSSRRMFDLAGWARKMGLCGPLSGLQFRTNFSGKESS